MMYIYSKIGSRASSEHLVEVSDWILTLYMFFDVCGAECPENKHTQTRGENANSTWDLNL